MFSDFINELHSDSEYNSLKPEKLYNGLLYHYTTIEGILGIINEKALRLSDVRYMNDPSEAGGYSVQLLREFIEDEMEDEQIKLSLKMISGILQEKGDNDIRCSVCFSRAVDKLSQWRTYSDDKIGYCIEFDARLWHGFFGEKYYIWPIEYDKIRQKRIIKSVFRVAEEFKSKNNEISNKDYTMTICVALILTLQIFKHPKYYEEEEVRITYSQFFDKLSKEHPIEFRVKNGLLIPYTYFPINMDSIKKIYIDNKPDALLAKEGLEAFLYKNKLNIECIISEIPRR